MCVTRLRSISSITASAWNARWTMYVQPRTSQGISVMNAPLKTSEPAWRRTLSGVMRNQAAPIWP